MAIEPSTGKVLANVSLPTYDPNLLASHDFASVSENYDRLNADPAKPLLNRGIQTTLPPGSTFKLVTAAAAIESGNWDASSTVPAGATYQLPETRGPTGLIDNDGRTQCDPKQIPFEVAMEYSCNTTFAQLGIEVGAEAMLEQAEAFGFNEPLPRRPRPRRPSPCYPVGANKPQTGQSAIGQFDVRATPLQMAMVAAGIANGGVVMKPYYVDEVQSADLDILDKTATQRALPRGLGHHGQRADEADGRDRRGRHRQPGRRSTASRWRARPARRRAASRASRRTPGTSRSHPPTTRRSRWR